MNFERHDEELCSIIKLIDSGIYTEARERAAARLAEMRTDWGYTGKTTTQQGYIKTFLRLHARAVRREQGIII